MKVVVTRVDTTLPLPEFQTAGAVAFDIYSRIDLILTPKQPTLVPSNLIIVVPEGHALILAARSSLSKRGLRLSNGVGIIDQDFHGPKDEVQLLVYNFTTDPITVKKGERLGQGLIVPVVRAEWEETAPLKQQSRGGFGTTGNF